MLNLQLNRIAQAIEVLSKAAISAQLWRMNDPGNMEPLRGQLLESLDELCVVCSNASLFVTGLAATRTRGIIADSPPRDWNHPIEQLLVTLKDESSLWLVLAVKAEKAQWYRCAGAPFGDAVSAAFPSSVFDIEEACKSYSLGRFTACAFHLMRALEPVLVAIVRQLGIEKHSPTWQGYLSEMANAIAAKFPDKTKAHGEQRQYFTSLESHLRAVKTASRNPTMHQVTQTYTDEMALELLVLVRGLMREASSQLSG